MDVHLRRVASELAARPCKSSPPVPLSAMSSPPVPLSAMRRGGTKFDTPLQPRTTSGPGRSHQRFVATTKQRFRATYEAHSALPSATSPRVNSRLGMCQSSPPVPLSALRRGGTKFDTRLQPRTTSGPGPSHQRFMAITKQRFGATYEATIPGDLRTACCSAARDESAGEPATRHVSVLTPCPPLRIAERGDEVRHAASAAHDERARSFPPTLHGAYEATIQDDLRSATGHQLVARRRRSRVARRSHSRRR